MRILHVQKAKGIGGSERHLLSLLPGLQDAGVNVRMWIATSEDGDRFLSELRSRSIDARSVPARAHFNPDLVRSLWLEIQAFKPSIVHTHLFHGDVYGQIAARIGRVPAVSSFHSCHGFFTRQPIRGAEWVAGRLAQHTIAISGHVRDFLVRSRLRPAERIRVIPYGIDANKWPASPEARADARRRFGLRDEHVAVGVASRLIPGKGHDLLLEAFAATKEDVPSMRLLIAGDGPLRHEIEQASRRMGSEAVQVLGFVRDIRSFMVACDVVVFPTLPALGEGFGLAALEAMAAERAVIATNVSSLSEIVIPGTTGILVPAGDPRPLASALRHVASDEEWRKQMGAAGRRRAHAVFGLDRMVTETLDVYRSIVHLLTS